MQRSWQSDWRNWSIKGDDDAESRRDLAVLGMTTQHLVGALAGFLMVALCLYVVSRIRADRRADPPPAVESVPAKPKPPAPPGPAGAEVDLAAFVDAAEERHAVLRRLE